MYFWRCAQRHDRPAGHSGQRQQSTGSDKTAAAGGVLTPQPCIPVTAAPWTSGSPTVLIGKKPALNNSSTCMCTWGGQISLVMPGQFTVNVP
jgi:hypothetical protein